MAHNAHRVFTGTTGRDYLAALTVEKDRENDLRSARDAIRQTLRDGMGSWSERLTKRALFESDEDVQLRLQPKFRMQGSFAYRTLNDPAQDPQEIDLDDGMFVPVSYLHTEHGLHPALISDGYFLAVETALAPLAEERGWTMEEKPSCVRLRLSDDSHVDIALYAIPDEQYETLVEATVLKSVDAVEQHNIRDGTEISATVYRELDPDQIMLAHREEGWKPSDPRKLDDWVKESIDLYGEQFRRTSRYLKGWRDHCWPECRLSSIALMAAARHSFDTTTRGIPEDRDDLRMLNIAQKLPDFLNREIPNPVVEGQRLDEGWSQEQRAAFVAAARELSAEINAAINSAGSKQATIDKLINSFGDRIPNEPEMIGDDQGPGGGGGVAAPAVLTQGLLKEIDNDPAARDAVRKDGDNRYG